MRIVDDSSKSYLFSLQPVASKTIESQTKRSGPVRSTLLAYTPALVLRDARISAPYTYASIYSLLKRQWQSMSGNICGEGEKSHVLTTPAIATREPISHCVTIDNSTRHED